MDARILTPIALGPLRFCNLPRVIWWQNFPRGGRTHHDFFEIFPAHRSLESVRSDDGTIEA